MFLLFLFIIPDVFLSIKSRIGATLLDDKIEEETVNDGARLQEKDSLTGKQARSYEGADSYINKDGKLKWNASLEDIKNLDGVLDATVDPRNEKVTIIYAAKETLQGDWWKGISLDDAVEAYKVANKMTDDEAKALFGDGDQPGTAKQILEKDYYDKKNKEWVYKVTGYEVPKSRYVSQDEVNDDENKEKINLKDFTKTTYKATVLENKSVSIQEYEALDKDSLYSSKEKEGVVGYNATVLRSIAGVSVQEFEENYKNSSSLKSSKANEKVVGYKATILTTRRNVSVEDYEKLDANSIHTSTAKEGVIGYNVTTHIPTYGQVPGTLNKMLQDASTPGSATYNKLVNTENIDFVMAQTKEEIINSYTKYAEQIAAQMANTALIAYNAKVIDVVPSDFTVYVDPASSELISVGKDAEGNTVITWNIGKMEGKVQADGTFKMDQKTASYYLLPGAKLTEKYAYGTVFTNDSAILYCKPVVEGGKEIAIVTDRPAVTFGMAAVDDEAEPIEFENAANLKMDLLDNDSNAKYKQVAKGTDVTDTFISGISNPKLNDVDLPAGSITQNDDGSFTIMTVLGNVLVQPNGETSFSPAKEWNSTLDDNVKITFDYALSFQAEINGEKQVLKLDPVAAKTTIKLTKPEEEPVITDPPVTPSPTPEVTPTPEATPTPEVTPTPSDEPEVTPTLPPEEPDDDPDEDPFTPYTPPEEPATPPEEPATPPEEPVTPPEGPVTPPEGPVTPTTVEIPAEPVPLAAPAEPAAPVVSKAVVIPEETVPLAPPKGWALVNLICVLLSATGAIATLFVRQREDENADLRTDDNEKIKKQRHALTKVTGGILALLSAIVFIITELPLVRMIYVDKWTVPMAVMLALHIIVMGVGLRKKDPKEDENTSAQA